MSSCRHDLRELLPEFVRGLLGADEMAAVADHLESCEACESEEMVLRQLENETLPDPDTWFLASLPGKVIAEVEANRRKKRRFLIPVWAGGLAAAVTAMFLLVLPGPAPRLPAELSDLSGMGTAGGAYMGLEEEIFSASGTVFRELEMPLVLDLGLVSEEFITAADLVPGGDGFEMMDDKTMRVFEDLVEKMARKRVGKRVTS